MKIEDIKVVYFPKKPDKMAFFKAAVLYILKEGAIVFKYCNNDSESTLEEPQIKAIIKAAVPGYQSQLLNLEIRCNINDSTINNPNLDIRRKVSIIAESLKKYVTV